MRELHSDTIRYSVRTTQLRNFVALVTGGKNRENATEEYSEEWNGTLFEVF